MNPKPFVISPREYARPCAVVGERITVLAAGQDTGSYEVFLQVGADGSGPPPHRHPWDEAFYIIDGEAEFGLDDELCVAAPGTLVHVPAGTRHWFRLRGRATRMLSLTSRPGAARMFQEIDRELGGEPPDVQRLVAVAARHGVEITP